MSTSPSVPSLPPRRRRRWIQVVVVLAFILGAIVGAAAIAFGPIVRARIATEAARRHLRVEVGSVRPAWLGVRLLDVRISLDGVDGVTCRLDEVRADLDGGLHVVGVTAHGGQVDLDGTIDELRERIRAWRGSDSTEGGGRRIAMSADGIAVRWRSGGTHPVDVDATNVQVSRDDDGLHALAGHATVHEGDFAVEIDAGSVTLDHGVPRDVRAGAMSVTWARAEARAAPQDPDRSTLAAPQAALKTAARPKRRAWDIRPYFPDLHALRARAAAAGALLAKKIPDGMRIEVDAFSLRTTRAGAALTLGPGPLAIAHAGRRVDVTLSTRAGNGGAPLAVHAELPDGDGGVLVTLDGGPVPLGLLGLEDGTMGLRDLDRGSIGGNARLELSAGADILSFDGEISLHGISVEHFRLASGVVRGLDLSLRAKGSMTDAATLDLESSELAIGALRVVSRAHVAQKKDYVEAQLAFDVPSAECQKLIDSAPPAMIPNVVGSKWSGTFEAHGKFAFDSRKIDDLPLDAVDYTWKDGCKITELPENLRKERFARPFPHRIYAPDGVATEIETTGPGTSKWTPLTSMSRYAPIAVTMTEDGGPYRKDGLNHAQIKLAVVANLKEGRFARGASSLIMQLAKNLLQTRDKTLARKLEQMILTDYIAQTFTKSEVLELYLNLVEFGPNIYGIKAAAAHYFGKGPYGLTLRDSLFLAALLPSPVKFHQMKYSGLNDAYVRSIDHLVDLCKTSGFISEDEAAAAKRETLSFAGGWQEPVRIAATAP